MLQPNIPEATVLDIFVLAALTGCNPQEAAETAFPHINLKQLDRAAEKYASKGYIEFCSNVLISGELTEAGKARWEEVRTS